MTTILVVSFVSFLEDDDDDDDANDDSHNCRRPSL
jgi:hypothetical protein